MKTFRQLLVVLIPLTVAGNLLLALNVGLLTWSGGWIAEVVCKFTLVLLFVLCVLHMLTVVIQKGGPITVIAGLSTSFIFLLLSCLLNSLLWPWALLHNFERRIVADIGVRNCEEGGAMLFKKAISNPSLFFRNLAGERIVTTSSLWRIRANSICVIPYYSGDAIVSSCGVVRITFQLGRESGSYGASIFVNTPHPFINKSCNWESLDDDVVIWLDTEFLPSRAW